LVESRISETGPKSSSKPFRNGEVCPIANYERKGAGSGI
jgi:hypothetical protein